MGEACELTGRWQSRMGGARLTTTTRRLRAISVRNIASSRSWSGRRKWFAAHYLVPGSVRSSYGFIPVPPHLRHLTILLAGAFSFAIFTRLLLLFGGLPHGVLPSRPPILSTCFKPYIRNPKILQIRRLGALAQAS
jgi:hypothetical protein